MNKKNHCFVFILFVVMLVAFMATACVGTKHNESVKTKDSEQNEIVQNQEIKDTSEKTETDKPKEHAEENSKPTDEEIITEGLSTDSQNNNETEVPETASVEPEQEEITASIQSVEGQVSEETKEEAIEVAVDNSGVKNQVWDDSLLSQQDAVNLINYIQMSVSKVINSRSKGMLEEEFSYIINNINPTALQDENIIRGYETLLGTLTRLKLSEMEKDHIKEVQARQRKAAITNVFGSFGSILTGVSPVQLAYAALSAALNYAKAVMDADAAASEAEYQIEKLDLEIIDQQRASLFVTSARVFQGKTNGDVGLITEEEMKDFAAIATDIEVKDKTTAERHIPTLNSKIPSFQYFAPFWVVFGNAYMKAEKYDSALDCYAKFEQLMEKDDHLFSSNAYYVEVAKNIISILMLTGSEDYERILSYVDIIKDKTSRVSERLDDMYYYLINVYTYCGEEEKALASMDYLINRGLENSPTEGKLSTVIYSKGEDGLSLESDIFLKIFEGTRFGYDEIIEKFLSDNKLKAKIATKVVLASEYDISSITYDNPMGELTNAEYDIYQLDGMKMYILKGYVWDDVLKDGSSLILELKVDDKTIFANYVFSRTNDFNTEFVLPVNSEATAATGFWKWVWGGYVEIYQALKAIQ